MSDLRRIVTQHLQEGRVGPGTCLLTVVSVEGSAYRRPGAHMIVDPGGTITGVLSGGCLESDLVERARRVGETGRAELATYDLTEAEEPVWGLGLGCPGIVRVLIEPITEGLRLLLLEAAATREPLVLAVPLPGGEVEDPGRILVATHRIEPTDRWDVSASTAALESLARRRSATYVPREPAGVTEWFFDYMPEPRRLLVFGAGPDTAPLLHMSAEVGFEVTVVDHRTAFAVADRFPGAQVRHMEQPLDLLDEIRVGPHDAVCIMTHHFARDLGLLERLLADPPGYLGLLGSASRREALLARLPDALQQKAREHLHAPIGIDLGAESPEEIAVSILAEAQAVLSGGSGTPLREHAGPIHARTESAGTPAPALPQRAESD